MKDIYIDIIEKAFLAYTNERIRGFIDEVKQNGITEHGFARLAANVGTLLSVGRRPDLKELFIEIMDLFCEKLPHIKPHSWAGTDFMIREICCVIMLAEKTNAVDNAYIEKWKKPLKSFVPETGYDVVVRNDNEFYGNWALFAATSDYVRNVFCNVDTSEFIDRQIASQLKNFDNYGMYMDEPPYNNHMVYDMTPRYLFAFLILFGYNGKYKKNIEEILNKTADITLKMQSPTGEFAFGGRSNQFVINEVMISAYGEMEATRFAKRGDMETAGKFKAAAKLANESILKYLSLTPVSHVKNRYDISTLIGCEDYGYFNKYMITVASLAYMAYLFADDNITPTVVPALSENYVISTGERFHKTFLNACGYQLELDTRADLNYDANGLGRVHKAGCSATLCLSHPFSPHPNYVLEGKNETAMSLCCYADNLLGAEEYAKYTLVQSYSNDCEAVAVFDVKLSANICVRHKYTVSQKGVDIELSGCDNAGFCIPVFEFDGSEYTNITLNGNIISVEYRGAICKYTYTGNLLPEYKTFYNRNGRYRVYKTTGKTLHIDMKEA